MTTEETSEENFTQVTCHCPVLDSASDWLKQISLAAEPKRSTTQIWVLTRHQYRMSALVPQTIISRGNLLNGVAKCWLFSEASHSKKNTFSLVFLQSVKEGSRGKPSAQEL